MLEAFLQKLAQRYESWRPARPANLDESTLDSRLMSLDLASAALRLHAGGAPRPPQIAVMGPTQTGKSTVVNLLLGSTQGDRISALPASLEGAFQQLGRPEGCSR